MTPEQFNALTGTLQALAVLIAALASLYAAIRGHTNSQKIDSQGATLQVVKEQTDGIVAGLVKGATDAGYAAGAAGDPIPAVQPAVPPAAG